MRISGQLLIGQSAVSGQNGEFRAIEAATGEPLEPAFGGASLHDLETACALADAAFDTYRETSLDARAAFLDAIGRQILALGDELIDRCVAESGLPRARVEGERGRTVGQLGLFASVVRDGGFLDARIDPARPDRKPLPRVDLRLRNVAIGPVAVFGASNFPLAFSVAGGDTASALAAGCPVIVKAHSAHPGTSELVGRAIQQAVRECGLPDGVFSLLFDASREVGQALVADPRIKAVGFTGSRGGGLALVKIASQRDEPIPVYAEMSSINPVVLLPGALAARAEALGPAFVGSLTLGAGQFCTNPGLVIAIDDPDLETFVASAAKALTAAQPAVMLTPGIHASFERGVEELASHEAVKTVARGCVGEGVNQAVGALFTTEAEKFEADVALSHEVFGSSSILVRCKDIGEIKTVIANLEGQLTATIQSEASDNDAAAELLPALQAKVGRILFNGWPTGVEVTHAMVHGGPFPSTSDGRSTSVGTLAMARFLRPVCYQDTPDALLPPALQAANPWGITRRVNGALEQAK